MILLKWRNVFKAGGGGVAAEFLAEYANCANEFFSILPSSNENCRGADEDEDLFGEKCEN